MNTYIAMLRGINVSGQKKIRMADLKTMFEKLECLDVQTYIQSGNAVFKCRETSMGELSLLVEKKIAETFGFSVPVILRTREEFAEIIKHNPFSAQSDGSGKVLVTFFSQLPEKAVGETGLNSYNGTDEFYYRNREIYLYCPGGYGKTKLSNAYLEKTLGTTATTRNWKTVLTLAEMAGCSDD